MRSELKAEREARQKSEAEVISLTEKLTDIEKQLEPSHLLNELKKASPKSKATLKDAEIITEIAKKPL